jgi:putative ABC transport system substrate-binding protein
MAVGPDLVAFGLVDSLAHPGGNVTGSTFFSCGTLGQTA